MYLKAIEIQGFKSFANKINFDFHDGITAIVGPNGSGKSNVADAVRWVLGEQSAKTLRGSSMQDVIFAGSSDRKAYSYAYVSIVLDNSDRALKVDFDEVEVSRRVYRSGESEYLLNNSACRLKDIQELFYDTGIGKEGYSIIGQGQIERILSEKPEERRELFDEAAGIVKLKRNKAVAIKKLDNERQSLDRVNDIVAELEVRLPDLKENSEKAREYLKLRDALREDEIKFFNYSYEKYLSETKTLDENIKLTKESLDSCDVKLNNIKNEYSGNQDRVGSIDELISNLSTEANDKEIEKKQHESHIDLLKEQINTLNERNLDCISRAKEDEKVLETKENELKSLDLNKNELKKTNDGILEKVREYEAEFEELKNHISTLNLSNNEQAQEIFKISGSINSTQGLLTKNKQQLEELNSELGLLSEKKRNGMSELNKAKTSMLENNEKLDKISENIIGIKDKTELLKSELEKLTSEQESLSNEKNIIFRELDSQKSKLGILKTMLNSYEGYSNAIRKVMEKKKNSGRDSIIGVVADIIRTESKYETAIEIALGAKLQNIIVKDEATAKELIGFLKTNKYGRATFLPLNNMGSKDNQRNEVLLKENGVLGYAYDLADTDSRYKSLLKGLLGTVIVLDTIDNAIALSKKYKQTVRMVTLQGELFSVGGSITGGDYKKSYNLLGRKNEIEELEKKIQNSSESLTSVNEKYSELSEKISEKKQKLDNCFEENNACQLELNELKITEEKIKNLVNTGEKALAEIENEIELKNNRIFDLSLEIEENEKLIIKSSEDIDRLNSQRARCQSEEDELNKRSFDTGRLLEEERIKLATLEQELNFNETHISRITEELDSIKERLGRLREQSEGALTEIEKKNSEIEQIKGKIVEVKEEHQDLLQRIADGSKEKQELMSNSKELFRQLDEFKNEYQLLNEEYNRLVNNKERLEYSIQNLVEYMWTEYELSISALQEYESKEYNSKKLETGIKELKKQLKEFGNVNIGAIEEYEQLNQRLGFLLEQKQDIEKSEEALLDLIRELDEGMSRQFKDRFKLIQEYFDKVFKKLFGGGNAGLNMVDEENILETGITINVQPPGKKLQNMMVLSGGEKSLTAIALLFAIQSLKPSPFCLLDEIEAALDDSNVDRFAEYLKNLTESTQFIIITHRKGTMTAADRLYGITMQEKGVSSLVSVNLVEKELN